MSELGDSFREMRLRKQAYRRSRHGRALRDSMKAYERADDVGITITVNTQYHYSLSRNSDGLKSEYYPSTGLCLLGEKRVYPDTILAAVEWLHQYRNR